MTHESLYEKRRSRLYNYIKLLLKNTHTTDTLPTDESIMEVMSLEEMPWKEHHH